MQVRYLCEQFAKRDPELSREQVRSHYYQLISYKVKFENYKKVYGVWFRNNYLICIKNSLKQGVFCFFLENQFAVQ